MISVRRELRRHHGRLAHVVSNRERTWSERAGLLLILHTEDGRTGIGEASPLPGFSPDTIESAERALSSGDPIPASEPAARFALETAELDLLQPGAPRFGPRSHEPRAIPVAHLLLGDTERALAEDAQRAIDRGVRTLKLKLNLGRATLDHELARIAAVKQRGVRLRLDANAQTAIDPARLLDAIARFEPELIEEPAPIDRLAALSSSPVPIALDESLATPRGRELFLPLAARKLVRYLMLKPMLLGGAFACLELAERARPFGVEPIVTHLFDGPIAHRAAARLAAAIMSEDLAAGLDVHPGLAAWPVARLEYWDGAKIHPC